MAKKNGRLFALALAAVMSLSMAACGDESDDDDKSEKSSKVSTQAEEEESTEEATEDVTEATEAPTEEEPEAESKPVSEILAEIQADEIKSATLKEVGKLEGDDIEKYDIFLYKEISDEEIQCLDYTGKPLLDGNVSYVKELGDTGLYIYYTTPEGDFEYCGLMDADGNVVLSTDEKVGTFDAVDSRYVKAYLPEAVTTDRDNAIYYSTSRQFSIDVGEDDVMYSGTVKLYDTQEHKFLENTAQNYDPNYRIGNEIITFSDADYNTVAVTDEDKVLDLDGKAVVGDLITDYSGDKTVAYDKNMNKLFSIDGTIAEISGTHDFYSLCDSDTSLRGLIHKSGTVMIEPKYKTISYLADGVFAYYNDDYDKQGLVYADGTELTGEEYKYITASGVPGFYNASTQDSKYDLIDSDGNAIVQGQDYSFSEGSYYKEGDDYAYFVVGKKDTSLKLTRMGTYLGSQLLASSEDNAIFDLVTGEKVLDGCDDAYQAYGYIYVIKDGETTIYKAE